MRQWMIGTMAALLIPGFAGAADVYGGGPYGGGPYGAVPYAPVPYVYSWAGAYVGANFGYQWGTLSNSGTSPSGVAGGFQGGYNWQLGQLVVGGEADFQLSDASGSFAGYTFSNPWFGTVRGRIGFALNNILFYGTAGLAYGRGEMSLGALSETNFHVGSAWGAGLEIGLMPNWSVRAEYLYIPLSSETYTLTGTSNGPSSNFLRFGVNYRF
jgi:outer membrane immunogenic protein